MGGGLLQLSALGPQDIYLTGNPQITYFKTVYKRHTNFSIETIPQLFQNEVDFGLSKTITISRSGDLIGPMYLKVILPELKQIQTGTSGTSSFVSWVDGIGNALIKSVEIKIGGNPIDKQYGEWLDIWSELNLKNENKISYDKIVGNRYLTDDIDPQDTVDHHPLELYIPFRFWFNKHPGLALPIIALQYHQIDIIVEFEKLKHLIRSDVKLENPQDVLGSKAKITSCILLVDYYYLSNDERRRFTQVSHEYIIETLQLIETNITKKSSNKNIDINSFNNPIKYLVWVIQNSKYLEENSKKSTTDSFRKACGNQKLRYSCLANINGNYNTFKKAKLLIQGSERIKEREADYFRILQNQQYFNKTPNKNIYTYNFGFKPYDQQPSGTCNFSKVDIELQIEFDTSTTSENFKSTGGNYTGQTEDESIIKIFGIGYNILRIMGGEAGLAYA